MADRGRGRRMVKRWFGFGTVTSNLTANVTALFGSLVPGEAGTILRMIGGFVVTPTAAPTVADHAIVGVGIGIVSADAATLGATAMPDPFDEADYPWLFWRTDDFNFVSTDITSPGPAGSVRYRFDVKSMRKIKPREALVQVVQYVDVAGAPPLTVSSAGVRVLFAT